MLVSRRSWITMIVATTACSLAGAAGAVDGLLEINHSAALAGGVTPGDAAGYPVTLSVSGSYRLTSNLTPPDQNTNVIEITAPSNVVIDMNAFSILGTAICLPGPNGNVTGCSGTGTGNGISSSSTVLAVENGLIQGMGGARDLDDGYDGSLAERPRHQQQRVRGRCAGRQRVPARGDRRLQRR